MTPTQTIDTTAASLPVPVDNTPALIDTDNDPWSDVDDGDLTGDAAGGRLPMFELNRKAGYGFFQPDTGGFEVEMEAVLLARSRSRAQWDEAFGKGDKAPDCRSFDGIVPDPRSPARKADGCADCPHSKWGADDSPPQCKESIELMVFRADTTPGGGLLGRIRFGGIAVGPTQAYWGSFNTRMPKVPPIGFVTRIELEEVDCPPNGRFLRPKFQRVRALTREQAQPLIAERDRRLADWRKDIEDTVTTQTSGGDAPSTAPPTQASEPYLLEDGSEF